MTGKARDMARSNSYYTSRCKLSSSKSVNDERHASLKLVVFDADGTLTGITSIWQHLHQHLGTWTEGTSTASRYWRGEIGYEEWARLDAMMWRGREVCEFSAIIEAIPFVGGIKEAFDTIRMKGMKIAVASAGLSLLVDRIVRELGVDFAVANELIVKNGRLTGDIAINVSLTNKSEVIRNIAKSFSVDMMSCAVIGDYCYDIPDDAGVKIAFNPKDEMAERLADYVVISRDLRDVLNHLV
jgi:phosphoserine phosphatase